MIKFNKKLFLIFFVQSSLLFAPIDGEEVQNKYYEERKLVTSLQFVNFQTKDEALLEFRIKAVLDHKFTSTRKLIHKYYNQKDSFYGSFYALNILDKKLYSLMNNFLGEYHDYYEEMNQFAYSTIGYRYVQNIQDLVNTFKEIEKELLNIDKKYRQLTFSAEPNQVQEFEIKTGPISTKESRLKSEKKRRASSESRVLKALTRRKSPNWKTKTKASAEAAYIEGLRNKLELDDDLDDDLVILSENDIQPDNSTAQEDEGNSNGISRIGIPPKRQSITENDFLSRVKRRQLEESAADQGTSGANSRKTSSSNEESNSEVSGLGVSRIWSK